jgi:HD-like signal output (HDOD) protein
MGDQGAEAGISVPDPLLDGLRRTLSSLRMLPEDAQQALLIASSPDCDVSRLASVIQRDIRLTTFILRIANSTLFGAPRPIASLHRAILYVGISRVRDLIIACSLEAIASKVNPALQSARLALWKHGFLTGILAVRLNETLGMGFEGEEFTAGLLHDFGRTLLLLADPVNAPHVDPLDFVDPPNVEERERRFLGISHAEFGAWFMGLNQLPEALVASTRFHHAPGLAGEWRELTALVSAADHAANSLQRLPAEKYDASTNGAVRLLEELSVPDATRRFAAAIPQLLEEAPGLADSLTAG